MNLIDTRITMQAFVGKDMIYVFESLISEGAITTVLSSFCDAIPLYGIKLVPFRKIMGYSPQHHFLVDVAGVMTGVEGERKYVKDSKLIDISLNIAVLGEIVDQIKDLVAAGEQQLLLFLQIIGMQFNSVILHVVEAKL
ncbi:hypothetical protein Ahy_A08g041058 [Arachis hypogaea]|uniref:Uncharacterized protein n=1 Tax=Arachis hypogaea TaxID=3818 RepID=A0A445C1I4_ARAHY|nr:hypothetical protein Ahy_A08g041058 [Arachis hypogaea]